MDVDPEVAAAARAKVTVGPVSRSSAVADGVPSGSVSAG